MNKILVIATYDSFLYSGLRVAERIMHKEIDIALLLSRNNQISYRQLLISGAKKYTITPYNRNIDLSSYDIIVLSVGNVAFRHFMLDFYTRFAGKAIRPLVIGIFAGVIWGDEKSILSRINADIILANNRMDKELIESYIQKYHYSTRVIHYGLVNINTETHYKNQRGNDIVFIDQVKIPNSKKERAYTLEKLFELAHAFPNRKIILKSRIIDGEKTVHKNTYSYAKLLKDYTYIPSNFILSSESLEKLCPKMALCLSYSSTVLFETLFYGIPSVAINDLGISKKLGNHVLNDSGLLLSFDDVLAEKYPKISDEWQDNYLSFDINRDQILNLTINNVLKNIVILDKETLLFAGLKQKNKFKRKFLKLLRSPKQFFRDMKLENFKISWLNRIGSDRIGSDRIGSDRIGSDKGIVVIFRCQGVEEFYFIQQIIFSEPPFF